MFFVWKILLGLCVVAALALSLTISKFVTKVKRDRNKRRALTVCQTEKESIFVMLVSFKDAAGAAQTLVSIFSKAACPLRVYVGLYEAFDEDDAAGLAAIAIFESIAKASADVAFSVHDHIRILRAPSREFKGAAAARTQLQRFLYRSETYVLCLGQPCMSLAPSWDTYLIGTHGIINDANGRGAVITTIPESCNRVPSSTNAGTFVAIGDFRDGYPQLLAFRIKHGMQTHIPVPALVWSSSLSFSRGALPYPSDTRSIDFADNAEDIVMSLKLLERGMSIWHATKEVACTIPRPAFPADTRADQQQQQQQSNYARLATTMPSLTYQRKLKSIGIDFSGRTVTARARLGLVEAPNRQHEIAAKIGTPGDFLSILSRIEMHHSEIQVGVKQ